MDDVLDVHGLVVLGEQPATNRRLQRAKAEVDLDDLFLAIHPIPARSP